MLTIWKRKITLMGNSEINGWRLICRPETVGKGQYVCIYSTCEYSDDSCWFSVIHDFNNEKNTVLQAKYSRQHEFMSGLGR